MIRSKKLSDSSSPKYLLVRFDAHRVTEYGQVLQNIGEMWFEPLKHHGPGQKQQSCKSPEEYCHFLIFEKPGTFQKSVAVSFGDIKERVEQGDIFIIPLQHAIGPNNWGCPEKHRGSHCDKVANIPHKDRKCRNKPAYPGKQHKSRKQIVENLYPVDGWRKTIKDGNYGDYHYKKQVDNERRKNLDQRDYANFKRGFFYQVRILDK